MYPFFSCNNIKLVRMMACITYCKTHTQKHWQIKINNMIIILLDTEFISFSSYLKLKQNKMGSVMDSKRKSNYINHLNKE